MDHYKLDGRKVTRDEYLAHWIAQTRARVAAGELIDCGLYVTDPRSYALELSQLDEAARERALGRLNDVARAAVLEALAVTA